MILLIINLHIAAQIYPHIGVNQDCSTVALFGCRNHAKPGFVSFVGFFDSWFDGDIANMNGFSCFQSNQTARRLRKLSFTIWMNGIST